MKRSGFSLGFMLLLISFIAIGGASLPDKQQKKDGQLKVISSPALNSLASHWAESFNEKYPGADVKAISEDSQKNILQDKPENTLAITSQDKAYEESAWQITIGRRVVVPVINKENPYYDKIIKKGISKRELEGVLSGTLSSWGALTEAGGSTPIHFIQCSNPEIAARVKSFVDIEETSPYAKYDNEEELVNAVQNDPLAIAFCPLKNMLNPEDHKLKQHLAFIPLDRNGNGKIDQMENICSDLSSFMRGVWIGKFPHALCRNINMVAKDQPSDSITQEFITYVLTSGQDDLNNFGFSVLAYSERQAQLNKIQEPGISIARTPEEGIAWVKIILMIVVIFAIAAFLVIRFLGTPSKIKSNKSAATGSADSAFDEQAVEAPEGLYYDKTHTWAFLEKQGLVRIGLDDFMQHVTGPLSRIIMKNPGEQVKKGDPVVTLIQEGKHLTINAPVSGTVKNINKKLHFEIEKLNTDPYSEGWIYLIEPLNWKSEIQFLKMAANYREWIKDEFQRLKDFIAHSMKVDKDAYNRVVLQDGGALKDHTLEELGPEAWEEFQTNFIDIPK